MTLDLSRPVQTRDGRPVRILCTDCRGSRYPIIGLVDTGTREMTEAWTEGGGRTTASSDRDLVNVPERVTGLVNVYRASSGKWLLGDLHKNVELACSDVSVSRLPVGRIRLDFTEGQFDE